MTSCIALAMLVAIILFHGRFNNSPSGRTPEASLESVKQQLECRRMAEVCRGHESQSIRRSVLGNCRQQLHPRACIGRRIHGSAAPCRQVASREIIDERPVLIGVKHDSTIRDSLEFLSWKVLTVQRTVAGRWWNYRNVVSPFSRLWLVMDGRATVRHHGQEFKLERGALHLVPAFTGHDCACPRRLDHYHLHFCARLPTGIDLFSLLDCDWQMAAPPGHRQWLQRLEAAYPNRHLPCFNPFDEEYRNLPASLDQAEARTPAGNWLEAQGLLRLLLSPFLAAARTHTGVHAQATQRFLAVQEYIHEHMDGAITLTDLARVADQHPTYFSDRFRQLVGVRPLEYLMRRRLERAQYLLLTTQHPVKEVSFAVGIHDPAYFTRVFVKYYGVSPTQYRTSHRV